MRAGRRPIAVALAAALVAAVGAPVAAAPEDPPAAVERRVSVMAPPAPREMTRLALRLRPFLGLIGNSWGGIGEARVEHYFRLPFMLGVELAPLALAADGAGPGAVVQARVHAAFVTDYLAVGLGAGPRLQRFGRGGLSIAPTLRLGSLDGLSFSLEYGYSVASNRYTGRRTIGFSNVLGTLAVPLGRRLALEIDGGFDLGAWVFATVGLRHRLVGDGGPGSWFVSGGFGLAGVMDRQPCDYAAAVPCGSGSARSFGPTIGFGLERRF